MEFCKCISNNVTVLLDTCGPPQVLFRLSELWWRILIETQQMRIPINYILPTSKYVTNHFQYLKLWWGFMIPLTLLLQCRNWHLPHNVHSHYISIAHHKTSANIVKITSSDTTVLLHYYPAPPLVQNIYSHLLSLI